jgi:hypothetical protein
LAHDALRWAVAIVAIRILVLIAFAEMAAALKGLIWYMRTLEEPTTVTLYTDS